MSIHSFIYRQDPFRPIIISNKSRKPRAYHFPSMEAHLLHKVIFFLICISFSPLMVKTQRDTPPGNIPIVNPTTPGTTPIVNPTSPQTPTTISPPTPTAPPTTTAPTTSSGAAWCIATPSASETALQVALDYACGYGGADCSAIQQNGACYEPNTVHDHASYAFNSYYSKNPAPTSCAFGGSAQLTYTDPSHGNCRFASSTGTPTPPPRTNPPPTIPMPPPSSTTTPVNPYPPIDNGFGSEPTGYGYGSEPTGTPNSAGITSLNLFLLIAMNFLILSVIANHF
ncbi:hypothetical protein OROHE_025547 [Orobanche hederae]